MHVADYIPTLTVIKQTNHYVISSPHTRVNERSSDIFGNLHVPLHWYDCMFDIFSFLVCLVQFVCCVGVLEVSAECVCTLALGKAQ